MKKYPTLYYWIFRWSLLCLFFTHRCPKRALSRNSLIRDDGIDTDESDIYGDLGDCSIKSEYSNSIISTVISSNSKEFGKFDGHDQDECGILDNIDLYLSFEEMSDALTTTASSFTLASSINSGSFQTTMLKQSPLMMDTKAYAELQKMCYFEDTSNSSSYMSSKRQSENVCITNFNFSIFLIKPNLGYKVYV